MIGPDLAESEVVGAGATLRRSGGEIESGGERDSELKPYIGIVHRNEGSAYGIAFPDAPGCFSASDTLDGIFARAEEALTLWLETAAAEGIAIPKPRDLSDVKGEPDWTMSFADAALVIAVPSPPLRLPAAA